jgi:ATP-dependent helicase/nuclease subunit B
MQRFPGPTIEAGTGSAVPGRDGTNGGVSILHESLARAAATHRFDRKLLVGRRLGDAREVLRALARRGTPWIGYEPTTPRGLAHELAADRLASLGLTATDEFDEQALTDDAIDEALAAATNRRLAVLAEAPGVRRALSGAVQALRLAGIRASDLDRVRLRDGEKQRTLRMLLAGYERRLAAAHRVDVADVFREALAVLDEGTGSPAARCYLLPGHDTRGLSGTLIRRLVELGATPLPADPVVGLAVPAGALDGEAGPPATALSYTYAVERTPADLDETLDVFAAASIGDELREVLRRAQAAGFAWDEVEIIASDAMTYGAALDALTRRLDIRVTYAMGLPVGRTRPGRVAATYLRWIQNDFPDDVFRRMLDRGDIVPRSLGVDVSGPALARGLRRLRIGRGRARYLRALERALRALDAPPSPDDDRAPEEIERQRERERAVITGLAAVLRPVLEATPRLPDRAAPAERPVSAGSLARGLAALLACVPANNPVDATARRRMAQRLERIAATATRPTTLGAAVAVLRERLDFRVPAPDAAGTTPWISAGGHLHCSDIVHGGYAARKATFVVGLDAGRFPGAGTADVLLTDEDRQRLGEAGFAAALPTAAERIDDRRYAFAALLARLRGRVTLSYAGWDPAEARALSASPDLLQAFRLACRSSIADYETLRDHVARFATAVPRDGMAIDATDVWLGALGEGGTLREGGDVIRAAFPPLDRGLRAAEARSLRQFGPHHGLTTPRDVLDPRINPEIVVSATRLQTLGACPRRYFLQYVLKVKPPEDLKLEPDAWLSHLDRGSLLHAVYEGSLRMARERGVDLRGPAFDGIAEETLAAQIALWRERVPPPGDAVLATEVDELREDVRAFVHLVRESDGEWIELERTFGRDGAEPATLRLPGGPIRVLGAIDRVDRLPDGSLVIIDYKTGRVWGVASDPFDGGRRLQHVLYTRIAEALLASPVARAEYHYSTGRGQNQRLVYDAAELSAGPRVIDELLDIVGTGHFPPTDHTGDCGICDFRAVCRIGMARRSGAQYPPIDWMKNADEVPSIATLRRLRSGAQR